MSFRFSLFSILILFPMIKGNAQSSLKTRDKDTVLYFSETTAHYSTLQDSFYLCFSVDYELWRSNGKTCLQKFINGIDVRGDGSKDTSVQSDPVCIDSAIIYDYLATNFNSILDSKIFPFIIKGSEDGRDFYYGSTMSHPTVYRLKMHLRDTVINLEATENDVRKDYSFRHDDGTLREYRENVNHNWNSSTALWKLLMLIEQQITDLEKKKILRLK